VLALFGPTATGKTDLAQAYKQELDNALGRSLVRLINMDSVQCYRELEIGTAKPPQPERKLFALMDFLAPDQPYSVARYLTDVEATIKTALEQAQLPLLVGGTMMYFRALEQGLAAMPESDPAVRAELKSELAQKGYVAMLNLLREVDPPLAARLAPNDTQRLLRGLEVYRLCGEPLSSLHNKGTDRAPRAYRLAPVCINPDKAWVNQRIALRLKAMLAQGLVSEVIDLAARFPNALNMPAFRSVGYRQVLDMLNGVFDEEELYDRVLFGTRQLAKRQRTWLRQWPCAVRMQSVENTERLYQLVMFTGCKTGTIPA